MIGAGGELRRFAEVIQEALNVLGPAKVTIAFSEPDALFGLTVNRDEGIERRGMRVRFRMQARVLEEFGEPTVQTVAYMHSLDVTSDNRMIEALSYHWHEGEFPHVHVNGGKEHIETGRVTVESLIRYCILEKHWPAATARWEEVLAATTAYFQLHQRWG
jgi:hypothetical protein